MDGRAYSIGQHQDYDPPPPPNRKASHPRRTTNREKVDMKATQTELNEAKACKWLDTEINDKIHGILTRRELLDIEMVGKSTTTENYASKKINGEYKRLAKPKVEYWLEMNWHGDAYSKKCPKYVWDYVITADLTK